MVERHREGAGSRTWYIERAVVVEGNRDGACTVIERHREGAVTRIVEHDGEGAGGRKKQ